MHMHEIADLKEADSVDRILYVSRRCFKRDRNGNLFADLELTDRTGHIPAKIWKLTDQQAADLKASRYLAVRGKVETFNDQLQLGISTFRAVETPANLDLYIPCFSGDRQAVFTSFRELINCVQNKPLKTLLHRLFKDNVEFRDAYYHAPAAQFMHHPYRYGLLEHSTEVAALCAAVCEIAPGLSRDLLVTGALLHDVGKIEELDNSSPAFDLSLEGGFLGHVMLGADLIRTEIQSIPDFPLSLRAALLHLILSHHSKKEWGAPVLPAIPEALVLGKCDQISAEMFYCRRAADENPGMGFVSTRGMEGRIYVGDIDLGPLDSEEPILTDRDVPDDLGPREICEQRPVLRLVSGGLDIQAELEDLVALPIFGAIAAGYPIDAQQETEGFRAVSAGTGANPESHFLLRVTGDSMRNAHILDGDLVHVRRQSTAQDGDIVAALLNGEVTVKRFRRNGEQVWLQPENEEFIDVDVQEHDAFQIQGRVIGLIREQL